ncbi:MAG: hypothetical protein LBI36_00250 [Oscillospiraceae bacterium]|jgi:hypothetical protein|nr:hypothetical protein [Oscillospiraceae bacterium]
MKKIIVFFKALMLFIAAVWGILFGILSPLAMLTVPPEPDGLPAVGLPKKFYLMWMAVSFFGFVVPCFLVMLKLYKTAASLCVAGTVALFIMHALITSGGTVSGDAVSLYFPLLFETIAVVLIAVFGNIDVISEKAGERRKKKDAPAPSVLGGGLYKGESAGKKGKKGGGK